MECEIYTEIAERNARRSMSEADIVDWFENYQDNKDKDN